MAFKTSIMRPLQLRGPLGPGLSACSGGGGGSTSGSIPSAVHVVRRSLLNAAKGKANAKQVPQQPQVLSLRGLTSSSKQAKPVFSSTSAASPAKATTATVKSRILSLVQRRFASTSSGGGGAITSPHAAPGFDAPRSLSAPGGWARLLTNVGIVLGAAFAAQLFLNRPQRDQPLSQYAQDYLHSTFTWLAGGLTLTAVSAVMLHRAGFSVRLMQTNPWIVLGVGLLASIGGMIGAQSLEPGSPAKLLCWGLFNASQAAVLSPLLFYNPALLARAALYTSGVVGSLCYVGATAKDEAFLWMGGPLLAGITIVALSSLSPMILPAHYLRTLAVTEALSMYGGLAVFGGFVLWDTQKVIQRAQMAERGLVRPDPLRDSIGLELDFINIFVRLVAIMGNSQRRK